MNETITIKFKDLPENPDFDGLVYSVIDFLDDMMDSCLITDICSLGFHKDDDGNWLAIVKVVASAPLKNKKIEINK